MMATVRQGDLQAVVKVLFPGVRVEVNARKGPGLTQDVMHKGSVTLPSRSGVLPSGSGVLGVLPSGALGALPSGVLGALPSGSGVLGVLPSGALGALPSGSGVLGALPSGSGVLGVLPSGRGLELDLWLPELRLAFEYQEQHHFATAWYSHRPLPEMKARDMTKHDLVQRLGMTLVVVPCWWDGRLASMQQMVHFHRPDLVPELTHLPSLTDLVSSHSLPPLNPAPSFFQVDSVPGIGPLMLASFPETIDLYTQNESWWLGEKYDGIRCCWNVDKLYTRRGVEVQVPQQIALLLGPCVMDSELWGGRDSFNSAQAVTLLSATKSIWGDLKFICFDDASTEQRQQPFEHRYTKLLANLFPDNPISILATRMLVKSFGEISYQLQQLVSQRAEGVILRQPNSLYTNGRSNSLLKLKHNGRTDKEALVVETGFDGLVIQLVNGQQLEVDKQNVLCKAVPGDVITFSYSHPAMHDHDIIDNQFVNPQQSKEDSELMVHRVRKDVNWEEIVQHSFVSDRLRPSAPTTRGYTLYGVHKNDMYKLLETLSRKMGFNPFVAASWHDILQRFNNHRQVKAYLSFSGNNIKALAHLFPTVEEDQEFSKQNNVYQYLSVLATKHHFRPFLATSWHSFLQFFFRSPKIKNILKYGNDRLVKSIAALFPTNYIHPKLRGAPKQIQNRRELYENFARAKGCDPSKPSTWYSLHLPELGKFMGPAHRFHCYSDYVESVVHVFPELDWDKTFFQASETEGNKKEKEKKEKEKEKEKEERRRFFDSVGVSLGFDVLQASNWYATSYKQLDHFKKFTLILKPLRCKKLKLSESIMEVYPEVVFDKSKFHTRL